MLLSEPAIVALLAHLEAWSNVVHQLSLIAWEALRCLVIYLGHAYRLTVTFLLVARHCMVGLTSQSLVIRAI